MQIGEELNDCGDIGSELRDTYSGRVGVGDGVLKRVSTLYSHNGEERVERTLVLDL